MDSDKPSNPSSKSGNADDLIEEMAKLMGTSSPSSQPEPETSSEPQQPASSPEPEAQSDSASDSDAFGPTEPSEHSGPAPEPVAVPRDTPAPTAQSDGPGWLPQSRRRPAPEPQPAAEPEQPPSTPERREPSFALRPSREETQQTHTSSDAQAPASTAWKPAERQEPAPQNYEFSLKRETPRSPEPQVNQPEPTQPASPAPDFDFGFGAERQYEPEAVAPEPTGPAPEESESEYSTTEAYVPEEPAPLEAGPPSPEEGADADPIAALIRDQLHQTPATPAPEPEPARPEPAPSSDNFNVPPVFGLGGDTSRRSMSGSDALDDIENLIGNAVRVDLPQQAEEASSAPEQPAPVPQPPVRPHQPRPAQAQRPAQTQRPAENVDAAEAAILAAMASNNKPAAAQQPARTEQPPEDFASYSDETGAHVLTDDDQPRAGIRWGRILMPVAALLLLGAIGFAGYTFLTATPPEGEAPVLVADTEPNKVTPEVEETDGAGDSLVFSDDTATDGSEEQLVSRDQSEDADTGDDAIRQIITADTTENGLANRRVRTVTVRPDGTIVRGDDLVAGGEALPVDRPEVPALPDDAVTSSLADTELTGLPLGEPATDPISDLTEATPANLVAVDGASVPFPEPRPDNLSALRANSSAQTTPPAATQPPPATATPQPATTPEQPAAVDLLGELNSVTPSPESPPTVTTAVDPPPQTVTAAAWVQLASQRDQAIANSEAGRLSRLYSSALGGRAPIVQQADLADRGTWYRVLVPAGSLSEAQSICGQITSIGGDCFARAN